MANQPLRVAQSGTNVKRIREEITHRFSSGGVDMVLARWVEMARAVWFEISHAHVAQPPPAVRFFKNIVNSEPP